MLEAQLLLGRETWSWANPQSDSRMGTLLLFCSPWSSDWHPFLKLQCCPFSVHSVHKHIHWRSKTGPAKGRWPCFRKSEFYSAVSRPSAGGGEYWTENRPAPAKADLSFTQGRLGLQLPLLAVMRSCRIPARLMQGLLGADYSLDEMRVPGWQAALKSLGSGGQALICNSTMQWLLFIHRIWDTEISFPGG